MSYDPREHFQQIQRTLQQRRGQGFGGVPGGGAAGRGILALIGLGVAGVVLSNSIFNGTLRTDGGFVTTSDGNLVDGGHRAIKYKRISGVGKEIYNEGA